MADSIDITDIIPFFAPFDKIDISEENLPFACKIIHSVCKYRDENNPGGQPMATRKQAAALKDIMNGLQEYHKKLEFLLSEGENDFYSKLYEQLTTQGWLSKKQRECIEKGIRQRLE